MSKYDEKSGEAMLGKMREINKNMTGCDTEL